MYTLASVRSASDKNEKKNNVPNYVVSVSAIHVTTNGR